MFSDIAIGIKTFLRDEKLFRTIEDIQKIAPDAKMIIADDGYPTEKKSSVYDGLTKTGHTVIQMDFDSGFGAKSNAIADALDRPYLLIGSDDFLFDWKAFLGIKYLRDALEIPTVEVAGGRVDSRSYEFDLTVRQDETGFHIRETNSMTYRNPDRITRTDLTANYCLVKNKTLNQVRWDNDVKIGGGEHGAWFYDLKKLGATVAFVPGVNIESQSGQDSAEYRKFRNRARSPERPCFDRRNIVEYILGDGTVDYRKQ